MRKILSKSLLTVMLSLCAMLLIPSDVHAEGNEGASSDGGKTKITGESTRATGKETGLATGDCYVTGTEKLVSVTVGLIGGGSETGWISADKVDEYVASVEARTGKKALSVKQEYGTEKEHTNRDNTRQYGLRPFYGKVNCMSVGGKVTAEEVLAQLALTGTRPTMLAAVKYGGSDARPMTAGGDAGLITTIDSVPEYTPDLATFFNPFGSLVGMTEEQFKAMLSQNGAVTVPYVGYTLCMSAGKGGVIDIISGGLNPWTASVDEGKAYFNRAGGSGAGDLLDYLPTTGNVHVSMSAPLFSRYVFPALEGIIQDSEFIFGVQSSPHDGVTDWTKGPDDRKGYFNVNVKASEIKDINPAQDYTIVVNISQGGNSNYSGPYLGTVNITQPESKTVKGSQLNQGTAIPVRIDVTGDGPSDTSHEALNKGVCQITVTVSGKSATFSSDPTLSDTEAKGAGTVGYNYVAWKGFEGPDPDIEKIPWALHSASDPMINGTLGANEYDNADFDLGVGIPSTENVYVLAGGETAISDLAGYFVMHSDKYYSAVSTSNQGKNQPGDSSGNPSVVREIMLTCSVENTWGYDNRLCHRQATNYGVSGGCECSTGGGPSWVCPGGNIHTGIHGSGNHCTGGHRLLTQNHIVAFSCKIHGTNWTASGGEKTSDDCGHGHGSCGACVNESTNEDGTISHTICNNTTAGSCSPRDKWHDCTWAVEVWDGDMNDRINVGVTEGSVVVLPSSITITANNAKVKNGMSGFVVTNFVQGTGDGIKYDAAWWKVKILKVWGHTDCTAVANGSVTWTGRYNQYFSISGQYKVEENPQYTTIGTHGGGRFHGSSPSIDSNTGATTKTYHTGENASTDLKCDGYSYGTGTACDEYENCAHMKEHEYTLKYNERIDFYVFRSITDAHIAAMRGSEITGVNQVTKSGYETGDGTYGAPISDSAVGQSATAPTSVGYLWRAVNSTYGSYVNGEGLETSGGQYNGRILFEIWKEPECGMGGALSYEFNPNFCLGNAEIKAILVQDHVFGNDSNVIAQYVPTDFIDSIPDSMENRGKTDDRFNHSYVTSDERGKGTGAKYAQGVGDCLNDSWSRDTNWKAKDDTELSEYKKIIIAEQNAVVNFWQSKNMDDEYHANIISDNICYGNATNTTQVTGEYYSVDDGIPLFNYLGGAAGRSEIDDEEGPIYRNHHSTVGETGGALADFIMGYKSPTSPGMQESDHFGFFGYGGSADGGDIALAESLTGMCVNGNVYEIENGNKGDWTPGADVIDMYRRKLGSNVKNGGAKNSGITEFQSYLPNEPTPGGDSFAGYWADHEYPAHVNETVMGRYNSSSGNSLVWSDATDFQFSGTNSGTLNEQQYGQSLLMHNLPLVDWTPNGSWPTVKLSNAYGWLLDMAGGFEDVNAKLYENGVYETHKNIVIKGRNMSLGEMILIYDPVSVENSINIGNQYGDWSGTGMTPDESNYDQRITSVNKAKNDFANVGNYVNTYTHLWTWIAPFGNFSNVGGSGGNGADVTTAEVYRNSGRSGYTDEMYIGTWTKLVEISYPFVSKTSSGKIGTGFNIKDLDSVYGGGGSPYMEAAYGPETLQNFWGNGRDRQFKFGNAFGSVNTVNTVEGRDLPVTVAVGAINDGIMNDTSSCSYGFLVNSQDGNNSDKHCNAATIDIPIDMVGQIGNLAIHDTTDFRFSTFFKEESNDGSWLINGIVKNTDSESPNNILSTPKDILFMNADPDDGIGHATLGITPYYLKAENVFGGLAGHFELLPLTPAYITIPEFKTDALRLGYKVYASIETIGNYKAMLAPGTKYPQNYDEAQDDSKDTRKEYMDITSEYYLYDFDTGKFYAIDLWSGPEGAKQCIYSGSSRTVNAQENSEPLYINMDEEMKRRNVSTAELGLSVLSYDNTSNDGSVYTAVMSGLEFIGYTGKIRLDTMDLTYIGSDSVYGVDSFYQDGLFGPVYAYDSSQRWHFTSGLTSTTTPTMPIYNGNPLTATQVENAYRDLHEKHPHAVIVEFQNYIAKGSVWTLKYKGSLMNTDVIKFYSSEEDCPYDEKSHITTEYKGYKVYNPATETEYGSQTIDKDSTPLVAYEAYRSNSEDRTTAGTH